MAFLNLRLLLHVLMSFFCLYLMKLHSGTNFLKKRNPIPLYGQKRVCRTAGLIYGRPYVSRVL